LINTYTAALIDTAADPGGEIRVIDTVTVRSTTWSAATKTATNHFRYRGHSLTRHGRRVQIARTDA